MLRLIGLKIDGSLSFQGPFKTGPTVLYGHGLGRCADIIVSIAHFVREEDV